GLAVCFGAVHRQVCVPQQRIRRFVSRAAQGDTDTDRGHDLATIELDWSAQCIGDTFGYSSHLAQVANIFDQDGELVAAKSRGSIARAQATPQPPGDGQQPLVTLWMSQAVIDHLET